MAGCLGHTDRNLACRNSKAAAHLKFISIFIIFFTSVIGISLPVVLARFFQGKPSYDKAILIIKCFAAGVILSTSLVHVLPDAYEALSDCQVATKHPWKDFPFSGLVTLIGALLALFVDITASAHVEHSHDGGGGHMAHDETVVPAKKGVELGRSIELGEHNIVIRDRSEELAKLKQKSVSQVLEIGVIFHSVIIGVTMAMSQNQCTVH
ncbi:hypothetical protein Pint_07654 [Pistacia integerrima]|uniref:Uncharacterized protein n=1 Tax=Pistacia integerrima TaxID=434235 RepID=A0ACC0XR68_9ROSI|nr:hypothetical protein Pint_07654 [Pistacia integerrima]